MKKIILIGLMATIAPLAHGQVTLTGTSYTQSFDGIATGLPTGWTLADSARAGFTGHLIPSSFMAAATYGTWGNGTFYGTRGGFKNYPSADAVTMGADSATQVAATDRALGVRQVTPSSALFPNADPGAAFIFQVNNTTGFKTFIANFKLQSLDTSSPRVTTWRVDYAIGATPTTYTTATTTGTLTTGNHAFTNTTINVNFGTALDNKSQPIWIRIATIDSSTGSGNRATTAIDDFSMSWLPLIPTATTNVQAEAQNVLQVLGKATPNNVAMRFVNTATGDYKMMITDINGRVYSNKSYTVNGDVFPISVTDLNLAPGVYFANMSNSNSVSAVKFIVE